MQLFTTLLWQIALMFALAGIGVLLRRSGKLSAHATGDMGGLLLNVVLPVVIVRSFWIDYSDARAAGIVLSLALSAGLLVLAMAIARLMQRRDAIAQFSVAFSNAGFIGIPLVQATLGADVVCYIAPLIALLNALQWTYGQRLLAPAGERMRPQEALGNPMVIALAVGCAAFFLRIPLPSFVDTLMSSTSALNTPLAMLILGCYLSESDLASLRANKNLYLATVERLVVVPVASALFLALVPGPEAIRLALLIAAAAPTGTNVAIFAQKQGCDYRYANNLVCVTTLVSAITLPALVAVAAPLL